MKTLVTARFDKRYIDELNTIATELRLMVMGFMVSRWRPGPDQGIGRRGLLISEFEDITREVLDKAISEDRCLLPSEAFASVDIEAATEKAYRLFTRGRNAIAVAEHAIALLMHPRTFHHRPFTEIH